MGPLLRGSPIVLLFLLPLLPFPSSVLSDESPDFTYTAVTPHRIQPFSVLSIPTTLHSAKDSTPVKFQYFLTNEKNETVGSSDPIDLSGDQGFHDVKLSVEQLLDEYYNLTLKVTSAGGKTVEERVVVQKDKRSKATFIQTDKPIYKPGETVKFRVFLLNRYFQPHQTPQKVKITIFDTQRNVIKLFPEAVVEAGLGFVAEEFELSPEPNLGMWAIEAEDKEGKAERTSFHFSVDQYVLPKYKVSVTPSPSFVTYNESEVRVEVSAIYSFGKPVVGECTLTLKEPNSYYLREGRIPSVQKTSQLDAEGKVTFPFNVKGDLNVFQDEVQKWGKTFTLFASCKDANSGNVRNETASLTMYPTPYKVEMVDRPDQIIPGFPLNFTFKVSTQDGLPMGDDNPQALKIEHGFDYRAENGVIYTSVPKNGIVLISLVAPTNPKVCYESFEVTYKEFKENFWLPSKHVSSSASYMQVQLLTPTSDVREQEPIKLNVKTSRGLDKLVALFLSRGQVVKREEIPVRAKRETEAIVVDSDVEVQVPFQSAPKAELLLYAIFDNGELIADNVNLDVLPLKSLGLKMTVSDEKIEPGHNVSINVKGNAGEGKSVFGLRAVDQSVLLLQKDNDLSSDRLRQVAESFRSRANYWGGSHIFQKFIDRGLVLFTNAKVDKGETRDYYSPVRPVAAQMTFEAAFAPEQDVDGQRFATTPAAAPGFAGGLTMSKIGSAGPSVRVRTKFPETWIWEHVVSTDGEVTLHKEVPDTITSWILSAFQLGSQGLILSENQPKVTVFRPFFIALNLPYSIKKGEVLALQVLVHNYQDKKVTAAVTLENPDQFFKFVESESSTPVPQMTKTIELEPQSIQTVVFPISPLKFGDMSLKVKATTDEAGDAVNRPLIVLPPGIKHSQNTAVLVNLLNANQFEQKGLTAVFPEGRVKDADFLKVSVVGDILGGTMQNLDNLIRLPRGCGEQNMVNFVPDIVILDYLQKTKSLNREIQHKATSYLEKGYQQQLTYLRRDGGYSAFGASDPNSSTWLTAFVTRAFIQAKKYISIDEELIYRSLRFLKRQQNANGSFSEEGFVYDQGLVGGAKSAENQVALTAFTLLTFVEAERAGLDLKSRVSNDSIVDNGLNFIFSQQAVYENDPYATNLITYLLSVKGHPRRDEYFAKVQDLVREANDTYHWEPITKVQAPRNVTKPGTVWRESSRAQFVKPATVEITSYGLLSYLLKGDDRFADAFKIVKWLLKQRNAQGGFISTQDTVLGLTALGKFAESLAAKEKGAEVKVDVEFPQGSHSFQVGPQTRTVLQEYFLPTSVQSVDLKGSGSGTALAQLSWTYYVEATNQEPAFEVKAEVRDSDQGRSLSMKLCSSYVRGEKSNMAILEADTPSGYAFDQEELENLRRAGSFKRYELTNKDSHVQIYFDSLKKGHEVCLDLKAYRIHLVAKHVDGVVKVFDYYDNTQKAEVLYKVPAISLCDICKNEPTCDAKECKG